MSLSLQMDHPEQIPITLQPGFHTCRAVCDLSRRQGGGSRARTMSRSGYKAPIIRISLPVIVVTDGLPARAAGRRGMLITASGGLVA